MKKLLVTGGSGFIGSHFINLVKKEYAVTNWDIKTGYDIRSSLPKKSFDYVVHFASLRSIPAGELDPRAYIDNNCWGIVNLLRQFPDSRFINISSSSVQNVFSVYAATKQFAESMTLKHKNSLNVRLHNVFGEGQPFNSGTCVAQFIECKINNQIPVIYGGGDQKRDFTYVQDVVIELKRLMEDKMIGTTHVGYGTSASVLDMLKGVFGYMPQVKYSPQRDFMNIMDSKSPRSMKAPYGRLRGIKRTVEWYENHYGRVQPHRLKKKTHTTIH